MRKALYQSVILKTRDHVEGFHQFLISSAKTNNNHGNGSLVKRLDVSYLDVDPLLSGTTVVGQIREIMSNCPNLILLIDPSENLHPSCYRLFEVLQPNLNFSKLYIQQLKYHIQGDTPGLGLAHLQSFQHIRALFLKNVFKCSEIPPLLFPNLEVLDVSKVYFLHSCKLDCSFNKSYIPRLHTAVVSTVYSTLDGFWKRFGGQIRTLWVEARGRAGYSVYSWEFYPRFPNIKQIFLSVSTSERILSRIKDVTSQSLLILGIHWLPYTSCFLLDSISTGGIIKLFPNLRTVHIRDIPGNKRSGNLERSINRLQVLVDYLDAHETSIRSHGLSIELTLIDSNELKTTEELRQILVQDLVHQSEGTSELNPQKEISRPGLQQR
jgi:hypothetical protein